MANITKIKAGEGPKAAESQPKAPKKEAKKAPIKVKKSEKTAKVAKKDEKKIFIFFRPFVMLGCYLRDSWREIRQVRWPSRKATWKMFFAVIIYSLIFIVLIVLLDILFEWIFSLIIK